MKGFSLRSLRARLILIVVIAAVPALGLIFYNTLEQRKSAIHEAHEDALRLARIAAHRQEEIIEDTRLILTTLALVPEVRVLNQKKCNALMADLLKKYPYYANLGVAGLDGHTACNAVDPQSRAYAGDRNWFKGAIKKKDFSIGEYVVGRITNKAVLVCGYPVLDSQGKVQSVLFAAIDLTWFNRFAAETKMVKGATLMVLDRDGTILTRYPDPAKWTGKKLPDSPLLKTILTKHEGLMEAPGLDGAIRIYAFLPLKGIPVGEVYVKIGIPKDHILSSVHRNLVRNLVILGLIFITVVFLGWMSGNVFILRQINALIEATRRLSAGDLSARMRPRHRTGEFDQLAHAFDRMAESLEKREMESQEADKALRKSEEKNRTLIDTMGEGIGVQDKDGLIIFMNKRGCEMLGYELEELIGKSIYFVFDEENQRVIREQMGKRRKGERQSYEVSWLRKDGGKIDMIISPCPVFDEKGNLEASVAVFTDITDRKRVEGSLRESEYKYRELVQNANSIILRWTPNGVVTFMNEYGQNFFGYAEAEILGRHVVGTIVPETESTGRDLRPLMDQICANPAAFENNVNENMRKDGSRVWIAWTNKVVLDEQGQIKEILIIGSDITERKRAEEEIRKLNVELEQRVRERTRELEAKVKEVERMNKLFVGRELRMIELRRG
ncbi:MAG: PAS domain S-box protein [Syntrophaceae bacterium]|nr:PAS domain S-box protein [Syntrophaceae bacterium]